MGRLRYLSNIEDYVMHKYFWKMPGLCEEDESFDIDTADCFHMRLSKVLHSLHVKGYLLLNSMKTASDSTDATLYYSSWFSWEKYNELLQRSIIKRAITERRRKQWLNARVQSQKIIQETLDSLQVIINRMRDKVE